MGREVGGRFILEGTDVYLWPPHLDVWQRPAQYCKAVILQLQINKWITNEETTTAQMLLLGEMAGCCLFVPVAVCLLLRQNDES